MRKTYEKPIIVFESFKMSTNIAAGCQLTNVTLSSGVQGCGYQFGGGRFDDSVVIFTSAMACDKGPNDINDPYDGICYHVPTPGNSIFTS